jgi:hypothetical protein
MPGHGLMLKRATFVQARDISPRGTYENVDRSDKCSTYGVRGKQREYSKTNPQAVRRFVAENCQRVSGLSRREALRRIPA